MGSRLFVGNLSTEKVQKKDVFRKFFRYGQLAQISLKQAYGFVQFMDSATCATALAMEQGTKIRGREIHLEVSKPAKSTKNQNQNQMGSQMRRRSRSPDRGFAARSGIDRYSSGVGSPRDRDNRRSRDEWRIDVGMARQQ
jgi:RNA recognition motif-containing protein